MIYTLYYGCFSLHLDSLLYTYYRIGLAVGVCQGYVRCVSVARIHFPAPNQRRNATKLNTVPSSNFRGKMVGPICQVFSWTDVPRMRLQLKILFGIKALPIRKKTRKTCLEEGGECVDATPSRRLNI